MITVRLVKTAGQPVKRQRKVAILRRCGEQMARCLCRIKKLRERCFELRFTTATFRGGVAHRAGVVQTEAEQRGFAQRDLVKLNGRLGHCSFRKADWSECGAAIFTTGRAQFFAAGAAPAACHQRLLHLARAQMGLKRQEKGFLCGVVIWRLDKAQRVIVKRNAIAGIN